MDNLIPPKPEDLRITPDSHRLILQSLKVRLIFPEERIPWNDSMRKHHYLGFHSLIGESLRYVAVYQNHWLALIGWAAPALRCKVRDQWIGWPDTLKNIRLPLIANNSRFLILPHIRIPNLASKILSLNLARLSSDWQKAYKHPIWIAETFVDPRYFQGTCYKAANWSFLGHTRGFSKSANTYKQHNNPKLVFIKSLCPKAKEKIIQPSLKIKQEVKPMRLSEKQADNLIRILLKIPEPRLAQGIRHQRISIIAIAICAIICNAQTFAAIAEWAKYAPQNILKRLRCRKDKTIQKYIPPSEPTIRRFLQKVDAQSVDQAVSEFFLSLLSNSTSPIAVDGKTLKGAKQQDGHQLHLLSAFLHKEGAVIAQTEVQSKTNEIPMFPVLLEPLNIEGRIVTADALHTQAETAKFIVKNKQADYLFIAKDNQKNLKQDISDLNLVAFPPCVPNGR